MRHVKRTVLGDDNRLAEFFDAMQSSVDSFGVDGVFKLRDHFA